MTTVLVHMLMLILKPPQSQTDYWNVVSEKGVALSELPDAKSAS